MSLQDVLGNITRQADAVLLLDAKDDLTVLAGVYKRPGRSEGVLQRDDGSSVWTWTRDLGEDGPATWKVPPAVVVSTMGGAAWTAHELGKSLGVDRNTARGYLDHLTEVGRVIKAQRATGQLPFEYRIASPVNDE